MSRAPTGEALAREVLAMLQYDAVENYDRWPKNLRGRTHVHIQLPIKTAKRMAAMARRLKRELAVSEPGGRGEGTH